MKTWQLIKHYLELGINIIPVRDKSTTFEGKTFDVKTPFKGWKKYQSEKIVEQDLFYQLQQNKTEWAAFICGKISNNLFNIDIDTKYYKGFDAIYFAAIREMFPDLWAKLRIHKTPSGGYHILYFMESSPPASVKLASRLPTIDESQAYKISNPNATSSLKSVCFLETRGEGSLSGFTGEGYSVHIDNPLPTLSDNEHEALITLGKSYNQIIKIDKPYTVSKFVGDYYDENPYEHFNNSPEGELVLENNGWKKCGQNQNFIWYSRPESKSKAVHASFNLQKRCFYIFTSSTAFEPEKGYNPSTALSILQFNSDKKATFKHLQEIGFGKVNKQRELQVVKKQVQKSKPIPENFSPEAKMHYQVMAAAIEVAYPFGTFWKYNDESKLEISREALLNIASELGFRLYRSDLRLLKDNVIYQATERQFQDIIKAYVKEDEPDEQENILNAYESFMQKNGKYTMSRLPIIKETEILKDNADTCYKFFKNGYIKITATTDEVLYYPTPLAVFAEKIQTRDYAFYEGGKYIEYLSLATNWEQKLHIQKIIGYLVHEFKDETTGYMIVLTEQCVNPKDGGGTGKNVFCNLLSHTTTYHSKNAAQAKFDEKFFQSWSGQRIMALSDVPKNFPYEFFKEPSTGTFIMKKLFKDEVEMPVEDGPKFVFQTQFSFDTNDGGLNRRIIPIEFTDFFTKAGGLDQHFGCHFPKGWNKEDWYGFDTFILQSVKQWLIANRKLTKIELTSTGWEKQFEHTYGKNMISIISEYLPQWIEAEKIKTKDLKQNISNYLIENNVPKIYWVSSEKQNEAIKTWCEYHKIPIKINVPLRDELNIVCKYFQFGEAF
jgi:hypothetical protein